MAFDIKKAPVSGGMECSDADAKACLATGGKKSAPVDTSWGQKDQSQAGQKLTGR